MWRPMITCMYLSTLAISYNNLSNLSTFVSLLLFLLVLVAPYYLWAIYATFWRDSKALVRFLRLQFAIRNFRKRNCSLPSVFEENVQKFPNKIAFHFEDEQWTFGQLSSYSNKVAHYFKSQGVRHGDCIALFMENRVEYIGIWLGLTKLGAVPALINTNLRLGALKHCIQTVGSTLVITSPEGQKAIGEIKDDLGGMKVYLRGIEKEGSLPYPGAIDMDDGMKDHPVTTPDEMDLVKFKDKMVYIFTSGTTGLPKAAVIHHSRALFVACGMFSLVGLSANDTIYDPLPLYHTSGGVMGAGMCLIEGATLAVRKKFSASNYWDDCIKYRCTAAQYIGEMCRFLLNTPNKPSDTQHKVRVMFGNGLRPEIWEAFQSRFGIKCISEFYGATEGNANVVNVDGTPGAIGFLSIVLPKFYPVTLIRLDPETEKPLRDANGLCIRCKPGESGEFVGRIIRNDPVRDFHGYTDDEATKRKIVRDVWKKGDAAFLSGDILTMDQMGYLFFKDRRGDTFRWKGENVSTTEVEGVLSQIVSSTDVIVYGVEVPGTEGRAGMTAVLDPERSVDLSLLAGGVRKCLPAYAQPIFLRRIKKSDMTGTYKLKKVNLQKEGFDVNSISDELYFLDSKKGTYVPLDIDLYNQIIKGEIRI